MDSYCLREMLQYILKACIFFGGALEKVLDAS